MLDRTTAAAFPVCFEDQRPLTVYLPISCRSAPVHVGCPFSLLVLTTRTKQRGKFPLSACRSTQCKFHIRNLNCFFLSHKTHKYDLSNVFFAHFLFVPIHETEFPVNCFTFHFQNGECKTRALIPTHRNPTAHLRYWSDCSQNLS